MANNKTTVGAMALGAVMGGITALLLAPNSGTKSRQVIKEKVDELKNKVNKDNGEITEEVEESVASRDADYLH